MRSPFLSSPDLEAGEWHTLDVMVRVLLTASAAMTRESIIAAGSAMASLLRIHENANDRVIAWWRAFIQNLINAAVEDSRSMQGCY